MVDLSDEVCYHIIDYATILVRVLWVEHALVQHCPQVVPILPLPRNRNSIAAR